MIIYRVDFEEEALEDLENIYFYIETELENPISAAKIIASIINKCNQLSVFPKRSEAKAIVDGHKIYYAHIGKYTIVYFIDDKTKSVHIYMVIYSRANILGRLRSRYK